MELLNVPFVFDRKDFEKRICIELYEGMEEAIDDLLARALPLLRPKAVFREIAVEKSNAGEVLIEDQVFTDPALLARLENRKIVFPYIATCGDELDSLASESGDMLEVYWYDALKQMSMDSAFDFLRNHIKEKKSIKGLHSINPGSDTCGEGWELNDQRKLFNLLPHAEPGIRVRLTESMLMFPNKTVSGFMFESDRDFVSCLECDNVQCPNRKMIHEGAVYS